MNSTRVVSGRIHRASGGGGGGGLIGGKLVKRKVRPPPVLPLLSALPLTEIASKAGPTKNNLDSAATLHTIVSAQTLVPIGRKPQPISAELRIISICHCLTSYVHVGGASFQVKQYTPLFKLGLHLLSKRYSDIHTVSSMIISSE